MVGQLENFVAIVTGAGKGIGQAIAFKFADEGAKIVVVDINDEWGNKTVKKITEKGKSALYIHADCSNPNEIKQCVDKAYEWGGAIHILVNNAFTFVVGHLGGAGNGSGTPTDKDVSIEDWIKVFNTNVIGYAKFIEFCVPYMRKNELSKAIYENNQGEGVNVINGGSRGTIVNMASINAFIANPEFLPYSTSKGAIVQLTRCTALDLAKFNIRVNAISPGTIETQVSYAYTNGLGLSIEEGRKFMANGNVMKRQGAPEEIANGALFLASDQSSFVTGTNLIMDGGHTL